MNSRDPMTPTRPSDPSEVRTVVRRDGSYVVITDGATVEVSGWVAEAIRRHDAWSTQADDCPDLDGCLERMEARS